MSYVLWQTTESSRPGPIRMLDDHARKQPLPCIENLDKMAPLRLEEDNGTQCLHSGRDQVSL